MTTRCKAVYPNRVIKEVITQSREAARGMMLMKYQSLARDAVTARLAKVQ